MKYTEANRPKVSGEAERRMRYFVKAVAKLQKEYNVVLRAEDGAFGLVDKLRKPTKLYENDGYVTTGESGQFKASGFTVEDFDWWLM